MSEADGETSDSAVINLLEIGFDLGHICGEPRCQFSLRGTGSAGQTPTRLFENTNGLATETAHDVALVIRDDFARFIESNDILFVVRV